MSQVQMKEILRKARESSENPQRLTEAEIDQVIKDLFHKCRVDTKYAARFKLAYPFNRWPGNAYIDRMFFREDGSVGLIAGQDYSVDIRQLREAIVYM